MHLTSYILPLLSLSSIGVTVPTLWPRRPVNALEDPSPQELREIEQQAHGTLSNMPPPARISPDGITNLQLIAFSELFEVSFFRELIHNITEGVEGFNLTTDDDREFILESLNAILAQEKLHAITANRLLAHFNVTPIHPCSYTFPVTDFHVAIDFATTFTSLVIGALQDITQVFAQAGDFNLTRVIAATIGNEAEQQGWYRVFQGKIPSEAPFLTTAVRDFAFTAVQGFTVPGSCSNLQDIHLRTFQGLEILSYPGPATQNILVSWRRTPHTPPDVEGHKQFWIAYINQLNIPVVEPLRIVTADGETVVAEARFPFDEHLLNGLTIAAVTENPGPFPNASAVASATLFGPGLIIVN